MTTGRKQRLTEARAWYPEQHFTSDSHIVKAYRQRFSVDKTCAMRELVMLGLLPEEKQKAYKEQLAARDLDLQCKQPHPSHQYVRGLQHPAGAAQEQAVLQQRLPDGCELRRPYGAEEGAEERLFLTVSL